MGAVEELAYPETSGLFDGETNWGWYLATFLGGALTVLIIQMAILKTPTPKLVM